MMPLPFSAAIDKLIDLALEDIFKDYVRGRRVSA